MVNGMCGAPIVGCDTGLIQGFVNLGSGYYSRCATLDDLIAEGWAMVWDVKPNFCLGLVGYSWDTSILRSIQNEEFATMGGVNAAVYARGVSSEDMILIR